MAVKKQTLDWIHILNEQTLWYSNEDVRSWLAELTGKPSTVASGVIADVHLLLNLIRDVLQDLHFHRETDLSLLQQRVSGVKLGFQPAIGALPLFRALPAGDSEDHLFISIGETALIQFCLYAGDVMAGRPLDLYRCEGLFRDAKMKTILPVVGFTLAKEIEWRCEIPFILETQQEDSSEVHRCADFFLGGKGKFCSDACRFATFQIVKQMKDPEYLADKQRRYRARKK